MSISAAPHYREVDWDVCLSANYLSNERPSGVMFGLFRHEAGTHAYCYQYVPVKERNAVAE